MYIGIDLGTSNSVIAGVHEGAAQVFHPADGGEVLPSAIYIDKRGHRLYGRRAYDQARMSPESVACGFKRLMGSATPIDVAGLTMSPEECSAEIIRQLVGQVTTELGIDTFSGVMISIPASFNQMQSEATLRAAKLAGLDKVDLVQEPVAAALAAMADAKRSGKFLIYDLGGGTFDVALVESQHGKIKILAQAGVNMLGGRDFDRMIVSEAIRPWLLANFDLPENFLRDRQYSRLARMAHLAAERAKIELTTQEEAAVFASDEEVRLTDESETEIFLDAPVTRSQFEELIRESIQHTIDLIRRLLEENEVAPADIDRIVFVGGPSRIPLVRRMVTDALGIVADLKVNPMTAVAEGAAYYCESRQWANTAGVEEAPQESEAKPTDGHIEMAEEPDLSFDYESRTADDKVTITVHVAKDSAGRRIRLMTEGWDSGMLPLSDNLSIEAPLQIIGENIFEAHIMDNDGGKLEDHAEKLNITRLVATTIDVPATQTIAVKVRKAVESEDNSFDILVKKGDTLPASGQLKLRSGTNLKGGAPGYIGFEVFQVEYPDRVELNLCVGLFRIEGGDLPEGQMIRVGDSIVFDWHMSEGGVLKSSVSLPSSNLVLHSRRFYAPQAAEISFDGKDGVSFARSVLARAKEEWGDLVAAVGPLAGPEISLLKSRIEEQNEILEESTDDPAAIRGVCEEARFIRQDTVRLGRKHMAAMLQRQLGKLQAAFNRVGRSKAEDSEKASFDDFGTKIQKIIDASHDVAYDAAKLFLSEMRRIFFSVAWRDPAYVLAWFHKLENDSWLFADHLEFASMVDQGHKLITEKDNEGLRELVLKMLDARISLGASDVVTELATIVRG
ncbi:MAG: Hsp70 family protein [Alphaproteobacteria bacterium]|nr:Hsp70 family protein [Alphaproteobacteria bacterium]